MEIKQDVNVWDLKDMLWSGGKDTLDEIIDLDKEDELMDFLETMYADREETPDITEVNDLLWFERNYVLESIGVELNEDGEVITDENREQELEVTLLSTLGEDEDYTSYSWKLVGKKLFHDKELMLEMNEIDNDLIAQTILNFEHDFVSLIENVETGETIFENPEEFEGREEE